MAEIVFHHYATVAASEHTPCPFCGSIAGTKIVASLAATLILDGRELKGIGRTRRCYRCQGKWKTFETSIETLDPKTEFW